MGCFNHTGNFSGLPIKYKDRVVCLVGISPKIRIKPGCYGSGEDFTPISLPIRGFYNDYGGVEDIDQTPGIKKLEEFFGGLSAENIIGDIERIQCDCENQVDNLELLYKPLEGIEKDSYYCKEGFELNYVLEHEEIFDYLVSKSRPKIKDKVWWRIPHCFLEFLGYKKNLLGKENGYEIIDWTHESLPLLKEDCYVWLEKEFKNYSNTVHNMSDLCNKVGCSVPKEFEEDWLEYSFKQLLEIGEVNLTNLIIREDKLGFKYYELYSFKRDFSLGCGLFKRPEGSIDDEILLRMFGNTDDHLSLDYMKECCELSAFMDSLQLLDFSWGTTRYYPQDINYQNHIEFLEKCLGVCKKKENEY